MRTLFNISLCLILAIGHFVAQSDSLSVIDYQKRQKLLWYGGGTAYAGISSGLYFAWYNQNPQSGFHFFDDSQEWLQVDKAGHIYSAYQQSNAMHKAMLWAGYDKSKSLLYSSLASLGFQSTIEIMDGFSSDWGFSVTDMVANVIGTSAFVLQEKKWGSQRIKLKMSYWPRKYSETRMNSETGLFSYTLADRAEALYGRGIEAFLKDYNGQTLWASFNLRSFFKKTNIPKWFSIAFGYSGENMFGGFRNVWELNDENVVLDSIAYPRYRQYILAIDYDLEYIQTDSPFVRTLLDILNAFKWPSPAIEYNNVDGLRFHILFTY